MTAYVLDPPAFPTETETFPLPFDVIKSTTLVLATTFEVNVKGESLIYIGI
jgi:hypothetical protein